MGARSGSEWLPCSEAQGAERTRGTARNEPLPRVTSALLSAGLLRRLAGAHPRVLGALDGRDRVAALDRRGVGEVVVGVPGVALDALGQTLEGRRLVAEVRDAVLGAM